MTDLSQIVEAGKRSRLSTSPLDTQPPVNALRCAARWPAQSRIRFGITSPSGSWTSGRCVTSLRTFRPEA